MALRTVLWSLMAFGVARAAFAQTSKPAAEPRYDPANVVSLMGTATEVRDVPRASPLSGVHVVLRTDKGTIEVYLAPASFLKEMGVAYGRGDQIYVIGSRVKLGDNFIILAREVRKENSVVYLRDESGNPNWPAEKDKT